MLSNNMQVAEKFREHLDKVQETIQEALDGLPDLSNPDECVDNKLLIPMLTSEKMPNGTSQVQMVLRSKESPSISNRLTNASVSSAAGNERTSAVSELDSIMCGIVDEYLVQMDEEGETNSSSQSNPS